MHGYSQVTDFKLGLDKKIRTVVGIKNIPEAQAQIELWIDKDPIQYNEVGGDIHIKILVSGIGQAAQNAVRINAINGGVLKI